MLPVFILLILALLVKDTTPLGDRYVLRAVSEGMALLIGGGWLVLSGVRGITWRHAPLGLYIGVLLMAVPHTENPFYVGLQVLSLVGIVIFSFAFISQATQDQRLTVYAVRTMLIALTVVCLASLMVRYWNPGYAYEQTFEGPRFRGLFSKPAMMGAASGLLLGLSLFVTWNGAVRIIAFCASLPCLFLTGSRTFWAAALGGLGFAALRYVRWHWAFLPIGALLLIVVVSVVAVADIRLTSQQEKLFRQDSIQTFSGRTAMWTQALQQYWIHPWLGYGFTAGGMVLDEDNRKGTVVASSQSASQGSITLHNGYVQALLDSGAVGAALYVGVIVSALMCFLLYDRGKQYPAEFYCLLFLAIANFGETVIFGVGVLHGVWFWYVTVLALTFPSIALRGPSPYRVEEMGRGTMEDDRIGIRHTTAPQEARRFPLVQSKEV